MADPYKHAGVNIEDGYRAVARMKKHVEKTMRPEVLGGLGGFGGLFDLSKLALKEPVLVSGTDGVGTKLMLAFMLDKHDTIGMDAVAMCVNDIIVQGAAPLFFLDYIACGKLLPEQIEQIVKGVATGCELAGCALIGGETAEMPGMYRVGEYDLAGFTVGAVEKQNIVTSADIKAGDVLIGLASSGLHSNGYSLVRKVLLEDAKLDLSQQYGQLSCSLGEELLRPTKIYVKTILSLLETVSIKGMAHITGGGFVENIPRMLPDGLGAIIEAGSWPALPIFSLIQEIGELEEQDMYNIFNMGIGMVVAVAEQDVESILATNDQAYVIGRVMKGSGVQIL